jgi:hypothetical protein
MEFNAPNAESVLKSFVPAGDKSVTLRRGAKPNLFVLTVADPNAQKAATRANALAFAMKASTQSSQLKSEREPLKIWSSAQPATEPTWKLGR